MKLSPLHYTKQILRALGKQGHLVGASAAVWMKSGRAQWQLFIQHVWDFLKFSLHDRWNIFTKYSATQRDTILVVNNFWCLDYAATLHKLDDGSCMNILSLSDSCHLFLLIYQQLDWNQHCGRAQLDSGSHKLMSATDGLIVLCLS